MHRTAYLLSAAVLVTAARPAPTIAIEFAHEMTAAMDRMMSGMKVRPTGDVDQDFAAIMIPHHQGAIDMAVAELRYGPESATQAHCPGNHSRPTAGNRRDAYCCRRPAAAVCTLSNTAERALRWTRRLQRSS